MLKMLTPAVAAVAFSLLAVAPSAASAAAAPGLQSKPAIDTGAMKVQHRDGRDSHRHVRRRHPAYHPGRRYRSPPRGWRRFDRRPGDWRTRGCIIVGPVWFCP